MQLPFLWTFDIPRLPQRAFLCSSFSLKILKYVEWNLSDIFWKHVTPRQELSTCWLGDTWNLLRTGQTILFNLPILVGHIVPNVILSLHIGQIVKVIIWGRALHEICRTAFMAISQYYWICVVTLNETRNCRNKKTKKKQKNLTKQQQQKLQQN